MRAHQHPRDPQLRGHRRRRRTLRRGRRIPRRTRRGHRPDALRHHDRLALPAERRRARTAEAPRRRHAHGIHRRSRRRGLRAAVDPALRRHRTARGRAARAAVLHHAATRHWSPWLFYVAAAGSRASCWPPARSSPSAPSTTRRGSGRSYLALWALSPVVFTWLGRDHRGVRSQAGARAVAAQPSDLSGRARPRREERMPRGIRSLVISAVSLWCRSHEVVRPLEVFGEVDLDRVEVGDVHRLDEQAVLLDRELDAALEVVLVADALQVARGARPCRGSRCS